MPLTNKAHFTFEDLYTIFGAGSIFNMENNATFTGVCTDTRLIEEGNIFVALEGNTDGHGYIKEAAEKGATALLVSAEKLKEGLEIPENVSVISTRSTLTALGVLGRYHRDRFDVPVIAIAGSNGKTSTKEMVAHFLKPAFNILKSEKNYNNKIGVPLTLLQLEGRHTACVLELGTNQFGEIQFLSEISNPTHGLITNIGAEHLEEFGDLDGVEMEEAALLGWLRQQNGHCYINVSDSRLDKYADHMEKVVAYSYNGEEAHIQGNIAKDKTNPGHQIVTLKKDKVKFAVNLPLSGKANAMNAIAGIAVAMSFEISNDKITESAKNLTLPTYDEGYGRMYISEIKGRTVINDTYNSNSDSALIALDELDSIENRDFKIAVLGDMKELGEASEAEHLKIIDKADSVADRIILIGPEFRKALDKSGSSNEKITAFPDVKAAEASMGELPEGSAILYKGSRSMNIERLVPKN